MAATEKVTYCRICEPLCGMVATVEDGELTKLRPDPDHPLSAGLRVPEGDRDDRGPERPRPRPAPAAAPARRLLRARLLGRGAGRDRRAAGRDPRRATAATSIGWYMGNPGAFSYSHPLWVKGFLDALGSPHSYTASSQDVSNRFAASSFLYGSPFLVPIPDLARTDFLLVVGANPLVSHGSVLSAPRIKDQLHAITDRGGRVVVVDPRRSETARAFEHVAIDPDGDAWMLLSMLEVIFAEGLEDRDAIERQSTGVDGAAPARAPSTRRRRPRRAAASPAREVRARWRATSPPPSAPRSTGAPARASAATAPSSPSCSTRSTWSPATSTARAGRCSATRRSTSAGVADLARARHLRQGALAGRRPARGARLAARPR